MKSVKFISSAIQQLNKNIKLEVLKMSDKMVKIINFKDIINNLKKVSKRRLSKIIEM